MKSDKAHRDDIHVQNSGGNGAGPPGIDKAATGIRGLDEVLQGGVPKGASINLGTIRRQK